MDQEDVTIPAPSAAPSFALALPHTPWIPERVESFARLKKHIFEPDTPSITRVFLDREPNRVWAQKMWRWAVTTNATHLVQIQDDVIVAPDFWGKLRAMVETVPDQVIGLEQAHPMGPELARHGHRWCRSRAWLVGVAWVWPLSKDLLCGLPRFLAWCDAFPEKVEAHNEDDLVNVWATETGVDIWHPIPTIIDHDTDVPSTYGHEGHKNRRPTVLWHEYESAAMATAQFWQPTTDPPLLASPYAPACWFCLNEPGQIASGATGARIGKRCIANVMGTMVNKL